GTVRAVLGIRGEPPAPQDPAPGLDWRSTVELTDKPGEANEYISVSDMERERLGKHPWSLQGGSTPEVLDVINRASLKLGKVASAVGVFGMTNADEVMLAASSDFVRRGVEQGWTRPLVLGDGI